MNWSINMSNGTPTNENFAEISHRCDWDLRFTADWKGQISEKILAEDGAPTRPRRLLYCVLWARIHLLICQSIPYFVFYAQCFQICQELPMSYKNWLNVICGICCQLPLIEILPVPRQIDNNCNVPSQIIPNHFGKRAERHSTNKVLMKRNAQTSSQYTFLVSQIKNQSNKHN